MGESLESRSDVIESTIHPSSAIWISLTKLWLYRSTNDIRPEAGFQTSIILPLLVPETMQRPSGEKAIDIAVFTCSAENI
jgi:hypothetical protein